MMTKNYAELTLAALIHDIGKVGQRAFKGNDGLSSSSINLEDYLCPKDEYRHATHKHVLYTNEFCERIKDAIPNSINISALANLASYHHNPADELQRIIQEADHLSSATERESNGDMNSSHDFRKKLLNPITSQVPLDNTPSHPTEYRFELNTYSPETIFPRKLPEENELLDSYSRLWEKAIETIRSVSINEENKFINVVLSILEKLLWAVPSATNVETPDISLFDHLKTTSAIAGCLALARDKENPFILAVGDFGGIQKYIFDGVSFKGLAKALRGRSFQVGTVSDLTAMGILHDLQLSLVHIVMSAGGKFYLLLPNLDKTEEVLKKYRQTIHKWILEERNGELRFNLDWMKASKSDIENFTSVLKELNERLTEQSKMGLTPLKQNGKWDEREWLRPGYSSKYSDICKSCYKNPITKKDVDSGESLCADCRADRDIGTKLTKSEYQEVSFDDSLSYKLPFASYRLSEEATPSSEIAIEFRGNLKREYKLPYYTLLKNNYIPRGDYNEPLNFEKIAERSDGIDLLGYLKADIDDLGYLFKNSKKSISGMATLSRSLEYFFSGYLYHFLETKYKNIYTVFSGGDDLFFIGPWDEIHHFAEDLHLKFKEYTCENKSWGISVGIGIAKPKTPISFAKELAENNLKLSKDREDTKDGKGKNAITTLSTTMDWEDYSRLLEDAEQLAEWLNDEIVSSSMIYRLLGYGKRLVDFAKNGDTSKLEVIPQMIYDFTRNWNQRKEQKPAMEWAHSFTNPEYKDNKFLPFICQYALYKNRKGKNNG